MSSEAQGSDAVAERVRVVADAVGDHAGAVSERIESGIDGINGTLDPIADAYNRSLGEHFGEANALQVLFLAVAFVALATAPQWGEGMLRALALACVWAIFAMSWDIQSGYTGYISFGHSVLSGAAAYTTAMLLYNVDPEFSLWITAPVSILAALAVGLLIAIPSLRLHGPYFSLMTFVAVLVFYRLTTAFSEYTGGELGIRVDRINTTVAGTDVTMFDPVHRYYLMFVSMILVAVVLTYVARSNVGLILMAIRENEAAVEAAGIDTTKFKIWSFVLSSIPMGLGGVLLVQMYGTVDPTTFVVVDRSIEMIAMAVLGGMSSVLAPVGGAFLFVMLRDEFLLGLGHTARWIVLWTLVLLVLVFAREGLFRKLWHFLGGSGRSTGGETE